MECVIFAVADRKGAIFLGFYWGSESVAGSIDQHADWILAELRKGRRIRCPIIAQELRCSDTQAKRVLRRLVDEEKVVFKGPSKTGGYVLASPS